MTFALGKFSGLGRKNNPVAFVLFFTNVCEFYHKSNWVDRDKKFRALVSALLIF
jgi:hypothetical protein